jgi:hypothetical protein
LIGDGWGPTEGNPIELLVAVMDTDSLAFKVLDWALLVATISFGILLALATVSLAYMH